MSEYQRPDQGPAGAAKAAPTPVDAVSEIAAWLAMWMRRNRQTRVPEPLPYATTEAARFWLQVMYPKPPADPALWEQDPDAPKAVGVWVVEARSALRGFLAMNTREREAVARLVTNESIPYRGESFRQYMQICAETDLCREDPATYRREALRAALARVKRLAAPGASRTDAIPAPERMGAAC